MKKKFCRNIIFSKTPLKSFLKCGDYFQIYPCDFAGAPQTDRFNFPLVIDFWYDEDEPDEEVPEELKEVADFLSKNAKQAKKLRRIIRLLCATTNHKFFSAFENTEVQWGLQMPNSKGEVNREEINNTPSTLFMPVYTYPNMSQDLRIEDFSPQRHKSATLVEHKTYFMNDPFDDKDKEMTFPDTIERIVSKYLELDAKSLKTIDTIFHLINNGIELETKMKSLSFLSFVSSIETLINLEYKGKNKEIEFACSDCQDIKSSPVNCKKCGKPIWGISSKFYTFLKTYVAYSEDSVKKYKRIYNLRSKLVHTGELLLGDEHISLGLSPKEEEQWILHVETKQTARLAVIHWLLMGPGKEPIYP